MRDLTLFGIFAALLPICVMHPWIGVLTWNWLGMMNPHKMTWGPAYDFPFAQLVAIATLTGLLFDKTRKPMLWTREMVLIALLFAYFTFTTFFAWAPTYAWDVWQKLGKILLLTFLIPLVIYSPKRIRWLLLVVALSIGFYGIKGGIFTLRTGGGSMVLGPRGGTFISPNTYIGLALLMVVPLLIMLARTEPRRWLKNSLYVAAGLNILSIPFTYSRGALVGLVVVAPLLFLRSRAKFLILILIVPLYFFGKELLPERLINRSKTIQTYEEDNSAMTRLQSWSVNFNIAKERPFTGAGFQLEYSSDARWLSYADFLVADGDPAINYARAAHSSYFQILGSHGFVAFGMFILLLVLTLQRLQKLKNRFEKLEGGRDYAAYASGIQLALVGFCVSGAFINAAYFDLLYLYVAMTAVLWRELQQLAVPVPTAARPAPVLAPAAGVGTGAAPAR